MDEEDDDDDDNVGNKNSSDNISNICASTPSNADAIASRFIALMAASLFSGETVTFCSASSTSPDFDDDDDDDWPPDDAIESEVTIIRWG